MRRVIDLVTTDYSNVFYRNSCGFIGEHITSEYMRQMVADQELFKKQSGLRIRVNDIIFDKGDLHYGREIQELKKIADGMAAYYAAEGFPTIYDVWRDKTDTYRITYAISVVSPVDGRKYTWNDTTKYEREMAALYTIYYMVTGRQEPSEQFNFLIQENH